MIQEQLQNLLSIVNFVYYTSQHHEQPIEHELKEQQKNTKRQKKNLNNAWIFSSTWKTLWFSFLDFFEFFFCKHHKYKTKILMMKFPNILIFFLPMMMVIFLIMRFCSDFEKKKTKFFVFLCGFNQTFVSIFAQTSSSSSLCWWNCFCCLVCCMFQSLFGYLCCANAICFEKFEKISITFLIVFAS